MRRVNVPLISLGQVALPPAQAHHLRDVLRLHVGDAVEVFDDAGQTALATIVRCSPDAVILDIAGPIQSPPAAFQWTIASAVPKGPRADWMIEKLSELGAAAFIPLITDRSVVAPAGPSKRRRWLRLAAESARQSRRGGIMRIDEPTRLAELLARLSPPAWFLSTEPSAMAASDAASRLGKPQTLTALIGPEGDWSPAELDMFREKALTGVSIDTTILRIETAAVTAAAIIAAVVAPRVSARE